MNEADIIALSEAAVWTALRMSAPMLVVALLVGLAISLVQALTQVQEMTLVFVPKIVAVFFAFLLSLTFLGDTLGVFFRSSLRLLTG